MFFDSDGNSQQGAQEFGAPGVAVYIDANDNAQLDSGELSTATGITGQYQFDNLVPGSYTVRVVADNTAQTSPTSYFGTGSPVPGGGSGANATQLFEMSLGGDLKFIGAPTAVRIDDLIRTNDGTFIGFSDVNDAIYQIDATTGQETLLSQPGANLVGGLAYNPSTDTIYAVAEESGSLDLRTINKLTGQLSAPTVALPQQVRAINFGSTFFDFDTATQIATALPRQPLSPFASTLDTRSDGAIFGLQGNVLNQYDFPAAGSTATVISTLSESIEAISFDSADRLFGIRSPDSTLRLINQATGAVGAGVVITLAGSPISGITGFDISPDGTHYIVDATYLYTFDPVTGVATRAPNRALPPFSPIFTSLSAGAGGALFATLFNTTTPIATIDPVTGLATRLGDDPAGAPYASVVVSGSVSAPLSGLGAVSDLTFDTVGQRIVGFDDATNQFFEFTTSGVGSRLATADRALSSSSLAFNGATFVMFDDADPANVATLTVNPDTGAIGAGFAASERISAVSLFHAKIGDVAQRVVLSTSDISDVNFGILDGAPTGSDSRDSGIYINELMLDPLFGNPDTDQYVELRGPAGGRLPGNTYLVVVDEDDSSQGEIHGIFDLSDQPFGTNGMLVLLQKDNAYTVDPASAVLESSATGFGGLPGDLYVDSQPLTDRIDFILGANGFFLIQSDVAPQLGDDIDANDDGLADTGGVKANWSIFDSLSIQPIVAISSQAYGDIVLRSSLGNTEPTVGPGVSIVKGVGSGYAGRVGDSIGREPDDWVFGTVVAAETDPVTNRTTVYELESGIFGVPTPVAFNGRDLDHIGQSNFNGGVHGRVTLFPGLNESDAGGLPIPPVPGVGITVFADINANGRQDLLNSVLDPDDGIDPNNLTDGNGFPIPQVITNVFPGVTVTTADANNDIIGFDVTADIETNGFLLENNRIFAHNGIDFFPSGQRLRFDLYRPASEVSIEAIGAELGLSPTFGRLEAYNAQDEMIGFVRSQLLVRAVRETITFTSLQEDIAYVVAYADENVIIGGGTGGTGGSGGSGGTGGGGSGGIGSPFGRFDNFSFRQTEADAVTDERGRFEIKNLFPGTYDIGLLGNAQSADLIGNIPRPISITKNENFEFDFNLRSNVRPDIDPTFLLSVAENSAEGTSVGFVAGTDVDGQSLRYSILEGTEFGLLINEDTGELTVGPNANLDFEGDLSYQLTVAVLDPFDAVSTTLVTVQLEDVNELPVATPVVISVLEDTPNGTVVGRVEVFDPDVSLGQSLQFSVIGGSGAGAFAVNSSSGLVSVIDETAIDFETADAATLVVQVSDGFNPPGIVIVQQLIRIIDQNDPPLVTTNTIVILENSSGVVGQIEVEDADANQSHAFELVGGSGAQLFQVNRDGSVEVRQGSQVDFEASSSYTLDLVVNDNGAPPLAREATVTIAIRNVNEPPVLDLDSATLPENSVGGTVVATIRAIDPEGAVTDQVISLLNVGDAANFDFDPATGQLSVSAGAELDFETRPQQVLSFEISDPSGSDVTAVRDFVVLLSDENDPPIVTTGLVIVSELATPGTVVGRVEVQVREVDAGDNVTVRIVGGNAATLFDLDVQTRVLTVADGAQFDADGGGPALSIDVEVTDAGGLASVGQIAIELNNVNEPPVFGGGVSPAPVGSGEPFELVIPADLIVDPEGDLFSLAIFDANNSLPEWLTFDEATRTLSGLPNPQLLGAYPLTLRAFEPGPLQLFNEVSFTVVVEQGTTPLTNQRNPLDVDGNRDVAPIDALRVINFIGRHGSGAQVVDFLDDFTGFVDVSGDGIVTALDALLVINGIGEIPLAALAGEEFVADLDDRNASHDTALDELLQDSSLF